MRNEDLLVLLEILEDFLNGHSEIAKLKVRSFRSAIVQRLHEYRENP